MAIYIKTKIEGSGGNNNGNNKGGLLLGFKGKRIKTKRIFIKTGVTVTPHGLVSRLVPDWD